VSWILSIPPASPYHRIAHKRQSNRLRSQSEDPVRTILHTLRQLSASVGMLGLDCAGGELSLPNDGSAVELSAVSGGGQEATVGSRLPEPLVVQVTDGAQAPVAGVSLVFRFQEDVPDAEIDPPSLATDSTGHASVRVRLGTTAGPQTIEAIVAQDVPAAPATFGVTALEKPGRHDGPGRDEDHHGD
jgi:hypothetical protein